MAKSRTNEQEAMMGSPAPGYKPDCVHPPQSNTWLPQELKHDLKVTAAEIDKPMYAVTGAAIEIGLRIIKRDLNRLERKPQLLKYINRFLSQSASEAAAAILRKEEEEASSGSDAESVLLDLLERRKRQREGQSKPPGNL